MDAFKVFCRSLRVDTETGRKNFAIIQAEDELASIGMVIGAMLERRPRLHGDLRAGHLADERVPGPRLLRGGPGGDFRHPARRALHRHADPHAAVRPHGVRLCLARRYAARVPLPGQSRGVLLHGGAGLRSGRAAADPGAGALRSRYRHERLDVPGPQMGRELSARPRQDARRRAAREAREVLPLSSTDDGDGIPTARCRASIPRRAYFTRGSGHNQYGGYTEDSRRVPGSCSTGC